MADATEVDLNNPQLPALYSERFQTYTLPEVEEISYVQD